MKCSIKEKEKLSIGDRDEEFRKELIESKAYCRLQSIPDDIFNIIVNYIQRYLYIA